MKVYTGKLGQKQRIRIGSKISDSLFEDTDKAVEGSGVFQRIEGDWVLMYDCYTSGHYQFCVSKDLKKFTRVQDTATQGLFTPRHGTVIAITKKELNRLQKAFPNNGEKPHRL